VIRVKASSFNYHDVFTVKGMPGIKVPLPVVIGLDMAGVVEEAGRVFRFGSAVIAFSSIR